MHELSEDERRRQVIARLNNLAHYVARGHPIEWVEPEPRGRKGPSRKRQHFILVKVLDVPAFDAIGWALMKRDMRQASPRPPRRRPGA